MEIGYHTGLTLKVGDILCFKGDLAAGKTTFIKGIARALGVSHNQVNSPTYVYLNTYKGTNVMYHFDLYRLPAQEEFLNMGFDDLLFADGICFIEWSERISSLLPKNIYTIDMFHDGENQRRIVIS